MTGMRRAVVLAITLAALVLSACEPAPGVYPTWDGPSPGMDEYERWLGRPVAVQETFVGGSTWPRLVERAEEVTAANRTNPHQVEYGLSMLAGDRDQPEHDLWDCQLGAVDDRFVQVAGSFVRNDPDAIVRLGWEMTYTWPPWSVHPDNGVNVDRVDGRGRLVSARLQYQRCWKRIVRAFRRAGATAVTFDFNVGCQQSARGWGSGAQYPGDAYVDIVGMGCYDNGDDAQPAAAERWLAAVAGNPRGPGYGLAWHAEFADRHGKAKAVPEWGVKRDNPYFVERLHRWMADHGYAFHAYFDHDIDGSGRYCCYRLSRQHPDFPKPRAAARFRQLIG